MKKLIIKSIAIPLAFIWSISYAGGDATSIPNSSPVSSSSVSIIQNQASSATPSGNYVVNITYFHNYRGDGTTYYQILITFNDGTIYKIPFIGL